MRQVIFDWNGMPAILPGMGTRTFFNQINTGVFYQGLDNMAFDKVYWGTTGKWKKEG